MDKVKIAIAVREKHPNLSLTGIQQILQTIETVAADVPTIISILETILKQVQPPQVQPPSAA